MKLKLRANYFNVYTSVYSYRALMICNTLKTSIFSVVRYMSN